jgi:soluble lytic murein transglycosylase-like protein
MKRTKKEATVDAIFLTILAICVAMVIIFCFPVFARNKAEANQEPTTSATTAETIEEVTEPIETEAPPTEPPVTLYNVPLEEDLQIHIINLCEEKHIDPAIVMAMAFRESTYNASAIGDGGNSYGLLQVQPRWHYDRMQKLGCTDLLDPYQNVAVGIDYLAEMLDWYDGNMAKALTAYNAGSYQGTITNYAKAVMATAEELASSSYSKAVS